MPTCQKKDQLCRCIDWPDEDFDVEIDHFIRNFEFRTGVRFPGRKGACPCVQNRPVPRVRGPYVRRHNTATRKNSQRTDADNLPFGRSGVPAVRVSSSGRNEQLSGSVSDAVSRGGPSLCKAMALGARRLASYGAVLRRRKRGYGEMKKKKITFSEPNCRFGCPHFKSVGSVLNETCYCMKKGKKGRRLGKKDLKRRPPEWCPRRLKTPVCRIYGFKDEMHEALELDNRLNFEPDKHDWYFPSSHHYQLQSEFPLGMTAEQFYNALQEEPVESVLNGTPLKNGELIEIDDGLASHFFYCYSQSTVLPAKVFGLEHEGGAHHA